MRRLIATDIDGTLVKDSSPTVDDSIPDTMHTLIEQGNICVVASGRQYENEIKKWGKHICSPYWENGVYQVLKELI